MGKVRIFFTGNMMIISKRIFEHPYFENKNCFNWNPLYIMYALKKNIFSFYDIPNLKYESLLL